MALPSGTKLGPYEVKGVLGAGGMGEVYQLSTNGGGGPRWSPDGRALLHFQDDNVVRVRLELVDRPRMQAPELLFDAPGMRNFDLAPDGNGFVAIFRPSGFGEVRQLQLVTNWFEELQRLAPAR